MRVLRVHFGGNQTKILLPANFGRIPLMHSLRNDGLGRFQQATSFFLTTLRVKQELCHGKARERNREGYG